MPIAESALPESAWSRLLLPLAVAYCGLVVAFLLLWLRQRRTQNATSVDAAWSAGIGLCAIGFAALLDGDPAQRWLAAGLGGCWSTRLTWHLLRDRVFRERSLPAAHREDGRYRAMREHWGQAANRGFFWFYQAQAVAALLFALPFAGMAVHHASEGTAWSLEPWQWLGLTLAAASALAEALADHQLARHRADPDRRRFACRVGLWRYSRHPNYFFEWLVWCGIGLAAAPAIGWIALLQPTTMLLLVRFVSGVPWNELQAMKSRPEDYARYRLETNTFVPWWPRAATTARAEPLHPKR